MGRTFWFIAGAGAGLYTSVKARRLVYRLTPEGVADQLAVIGLGARAFTEEVREGMAEREAQLATQLGLPALEPADSPRAVDVGRVAERAPQPALEQPVASRPRALAPFRS